MSSVPILCPVSKEVRRQLKKRTVLTGNLYRSDKRRATTAREDLPSELQIPQPQVLRYHGGSNSLFIAANSSGIGVSGIRTCPSGSHSCIHWVAWL